MNICFYHPHLLLKEYIRGYTITDLQRDEGQHFSIELVPGGYPAMGIVLDDNVVIEHEDSLRQYNYSFHFLGQVTESHRFVTNIRRIINVLFEPWAPYELFGIPQYYFANTGMDVSAFLPDTEPVYARLKERQCDYLKCIEVLDHYFLQLLAKRRASSRISSQLFRYICRERGNLTQKELQSFTCMGKTAFHEAFKNVVGISSKLYCRIIRFNHVYAKIQEKNIRWKDLIYDDYYDQAHFIKEFRNFTAVSPGNLHPGKTDLYQDALGLANKLGC